MTERLSDGRAAATRARALKDAIEACKKEGEAFLSPEVGDVCLRHGFSMPLLRCGSWWMALSDEEQADD